MKMPGLFRQPLSYLVMFWLILALPDGSAAAPLEAREPDTPSKGAHVKVEAPLLQPVPVTFDGETLFTFKARLLSITPEMRARILTERLATLADDPSFHPEQMKILDEEGASAIMAGDYFVMAVTDKDATAEGMKRQEMAQGFATIIRNAIIAHRQAVKPEQLLRSALYAAGATLVLLIVLILIAKGRRRLIRFLDELLTGRGLRILSYELVKEQHIRAFITGVVTVVRVLFVASLLLAYLQVVLNLFPWTRGFAHKTLDLILAPLKIIGHGIAGYIPNLFFIAVLIVLTHYLLRFIRFIFSEIDSGVITIPGFYRDWAWPTFNIVRLLVIAFVAVVAFPYIPGSDSPAFKGISIFVGVLFSLGSTSAIGSIVAGMILTYMRPFLIGDRVKIADTVGDVVEKNLLVTRIKTIKNVEITIPNSLILGTHIINYSFLAKEQGLILHTSVTIGYDAPWRTVHDLLIAAARATAYILPEPQPFVFQTALNDFYVSYEINAYTDEPNLMADIYSELHQNIQEKFNEAGVEIMSPHYTQLRDGNTVTIPAAYRPADYTPPSFRVRQTAGEGPQG